MRKFFVLLTAFMCAFITACGQENIITPEPEKVYVDRVVEVEKPFDIMEIRGTIYFSSSFINYTTTIDGTTYLKKAYVSVEHNVFDEGLEVVGIVVHFSNNSMPVVNGDIKEDNQGFMRNVVRFNGQDILEGSIVRIRLTEKKRLGVYQGSLL